MLAFEALAMVNITPVTSSISLPDARAGIKGEVLQLGILECIAPFSKDRLGGGSISFRVVTASCPGGAVSSPQGYLLCFPRAVC